MEELITEAANKGSVSSGGPSRCGTPEGFFKFYMEICRKIYRDNVRIMGKIVMEAKRKIVSQHYPDDVLYGPAVVWTLFGDPALKIKYPVQSTSLYVRPAQKTGKTLCSVIGSSLLMPKSTKITVYTSNGAVVFMKDNIERNSRIRLKSGVYFIHIREVKNEVVQKVVILK